MAVEIERKFLVEKALLPPLKDGRHIRQGYIMRGSDRSLRIREIDERFILTFKAGKGIKRTEIERDLSIEEGTHLFDGCLLEPALEKMRHIVPNGKHKWEVDVFMGVNEGLIVAEIELTREDEIFDRPDWLVAEVSHDPRYLNSALAEHPFCNWGT